MIEARAVHERLGSLEGVVVHSGVASHPKDIDLYVPEHQLRKAQHILQDNLYIRVSDTSYHSLYAKFENGELFLFDLTTAYNHYLERVPSMKLSSEGSRILGTDLQTNLSFKKIISSKNLQDIDIPVLRKLLLIPMKKMHR